MGSWPYLIADQELTLRPLRFRDRAKWQQVRAANAQWLAPWEATRPPLESDRPLPSYFEMVRYYNKEGRELRSVSLGIWLHVGGGDQLIGQITLGGIVLGAYRGGHIGYWIDQRFANRGFTTRAVKALTDFAFNELQLHRIEINLRPENGASKKVAEKSGYSFEGLRPRYLHIAGDWRDHLTFVAENPNNFN
jgi:[ribosomal protein S5]-alanine N-acetyltransferase